MFRNFLCQFLLTFSCRLSVQCPRVAFGLYIQMLLLLLTSSLRKVIKFWIGLLRNVIITGNVRSNELQLYGWNKQSQI